MALSNGQSKPDIAHCSYIYVLVLGAALPSATFLAALMIYVDIYRDTVVVHSDWLLCTRFWQLAEL